ncbi:hypothetical protein FH581_013655 [Leptospira weilii]|uniref:hypothetical protein n=1 Tax=Leptospira weilii TaxID=28184 RepID=UPI00201B47BA|nr:hypothetical protein [Leptospira weilii]UPY76981.1 hypothetical protein FH581_013655 [Leptospira weilii]
MITRKITISILLIGAIFACEAKENQEMKGKISNQKPVEITLENANAYFRKLTEKDGGKYTPIVNADIGKVEDSKVQILMTMPCVFLVCSKILTHFH